MNWPFNIVAILNDERANAGYTPEKKAPTPINTTNKIQVGMDKANGLPVNWLKEYDDNSTARLAIMIAAKLKKMASKMCCLII